MPAVPILNVVDNDDVADASVVGDVRLELVDHTAVYVTGVLPMEDPSVYVVTAFQESVSACAPIAYRMTIGTRIKDMMTLLVFIISSMAPFSSSSLAPDHGCREMGFQPIHAYRPDA